MEELKVPKVNVLEIYKRVGSDGKQLLKDIFGAKALIGDMREWETYIMDRIKYFEDACIEIGEDPLAPKFSEGEPDVIAYLKGKVVVRALNGPYVLDYNDGNQRKWEAWLKYDGSGFRFFVAVYGVSDSLTGSGSRLRLCSEVLAKYFATQFPEMMMPFWL